MADLIPRCPCGSQRIETMKTRKAWEAGSPEIHSWRCSACGRSAEGPVPLLPRIAPQDEPPPAGGGGA